MTSRTSFSADTQQTAENNTLFTAENESGAGKGAFSPNQGRNRNTGSTNCYSNNTGFFARQKELFKRRLWPAALTFLGFLLYNVIGLATSLSAANQDAIEQRMSAAERAVLFRDVLKGMLGYTNLSVLIILVPVAAVLAIEGFSWMDSRRQVDFYESQPLSRGKRFLDICVSSFLYFFFSYVITLEAGLLISGIFHGLTRAVLAEIVWNAACALALFLSVYSLGVLASMLTGNMIVTWLAFLVMILYGPIFKAVLGGYCSEYLTTYGGTPGALSCVDFLNPVVRYYESAPFDLKMPLLLIAIAALHLALAWLCYGIRNNEQAGTPVVFGPVRTFVRIAMSVIVGLVIGLFFSSVRNSIFIILVWIFLFTVITACIMQIIYDLDFRALFRRPLEILASMAIVLLIFFLFLFDAAGYDRFVPDPEKVEDAALYCTNTDIVNISDEGKYDDNNSFPEKYMHLTNVEDVIAVAKYGQEYTRLIKGKPVLFPSGKTSGDKGGPENGSGNNGTGSDISEDGSGNNGTGNGISEDGSGNNGTDSDISEDGSDGNGTGSGNPGDDTGSIGTDTGLPGGQTGKNTVWDFKVLYRMKNGEKISRAFMIPSRIDPAMMDAVTGTEEYREGTSNIYHDKYMREALSESAKIQLSYTNGSDFLSGPFIGLNDYEEFRKAYTLDLEQYSYSFARQNRPVGSLGISASMISGRDDIPAVSYSVYPSYSHTIAFLKKKGCWLEPLDLSKIPAGDYDSLTPPQQKLIDTLDTSVLSNTFNPYYY